MSQTIEISKETAVRIAEQAKLVGLSVDDYLRSLMPNGNGVNAERPINEVSKRQKLADAIKEWAESHDPDAPAIPLESLRRENLY